MSDIKRIHIKEDEVYEILNMHTINKSLNQKYICGVERFLKKA